MDGAAVVSDLVRTMRLSDFLSGACLPSLNPERGRDSSPKTTPALYPHHPCCSEDWLPFPGVIGVIITNGWSPGLIQGEEMLVNLALTLQ